MANPLVCGPLAYELNESSWLSASSAQYGLERLWALVSGGAEHAVEPLLSFAACSSQAPHQLIAMKEEELPYLTLSELLPKGASTPLQEHTLPALFLVGSNKSLPVMELRDERSVHFNVDLVATTFFMLSRWEETSTDVSDEHGRFPAHASVAYRHGFLERPIVDEWAMVVRAWIERLSPGWHAQRSGFKVQLSHDLDHPLRYPSAMSVLRHTAGAGVYGPGIREAWREVYQGVNSLRNWRSDPFYKGLSHLMTMSEEFGVSSAFYFMATTKSAFDEGYNLAKHPYRDILAEVAERGHEVGLHASYNAYGDAGRLMEEKRRLESCLGKKVQGGRHHYLRFKASDSWRTWEEVGFGYDSTVGYADHAGFRCGTCSPFPVYDVARNQTLKLVEVPLVVMEGSLAGSRDMHTSPSEVESTILALARRCHAVDGTFTLLWHNSSFHGPLWQGMGTVYHRVLLGLVGM